MSVLETPRILFRGEIGWDPVTTNNYPANYNEDSCETEFTAASTVAQFRQSAIVQVATQGNWNPHGTHRSTFFNTFVSGTDTGSGLDTQDPFNRAPVEFTGMLVDCEPYGATSSQLFFDSMSFGIPGGCRIFAPRTFRVHDRYVNFNRNPSNNMIAGIASVMWQTSFPKDAGLAIDAHGSGALVALMAALGETGVLGITVRWNTYRTIYYDDPGLANAAAGPAAAGLVARLNGGGWQPNPARSLVVGVIGLWREGEPMFEPADRALIATSAPFSGYTPPPRTPPPAVATAHARLTANSITIDLSNCIPEIDRAPNKFDLGPLAIVAVDPANDAMVLATLATLDSTHYDKAAYEAGAGIVTLPVDPTNAAIAATANLQLRTTTATQFLASGAALATETALRAIPSQPNVYVQEGEALSTVVNVYNRGAPAGAGIDVTLALVGAVSQGVDTQQTGADGKVHFALTGATGSVTQYAILPIGTAPPFGAIDPQVQTYMTVRVLPADNAIAGMEPSWANVHAHVLANWEAMAPCMDNWLVLGDEAQVRRYAPILKRLTDPANFESFRYMPVVRDMTAGQRTLLWNFLDGARPRANPLIGSLAPEQSARSGFDLTELSHAMRNH